MSTGPRAKVYLLKAARESDQGQTFREEGNRNEETSDEVTEDDPFITGLLSVNIESCLLPVIAFEYCNLEELWRHLKHPQLYAVNANQAISMPLLYPCGAQRRDVLQRKLADAKIKCSHSVVYNTVKNPLLDQRLADVTKEIKTLQNPTILCFFSPSGVKYVMESLDPNFMSLEEIHMVAIGPTTKTALEDTLSKLGIGKRVMACKDPTPEALVDLIQREITDKKMCQVTV